MTHALAAILALLIGIAGWYYTFYSQAATRLGQIESPKINRRRRLLRRTNGVTMLLLAALFYAGISTEAPEPFVLIWLSVCLLLAVVIALGLVDVWLTSRLRRKQ